MHEPVILTAVDESFGEPRMSRLRWPKGASCVFVTIEYEGLVFTVAKAKIILGGGDGKPKKVYEAEGISRVSPLDEKHRDPIAGKEKAIKRAIEALHTRVMKHRRSFHHYRG